MLDGLEIAHLVMNVITGAFAVLMIFVKPFRNFILGRKKEEERKKEHEIDQTETYVCLLRDRILYSYYSHKERRQIHQYEFESISKCYKQYEKFGGNGFVKKIWEEMQDWEIIE